MHSHPPRFVPSFFLFAVASAGSAIGVLLVAFALHALGRLDYAGLRLTLEIVVALIGALVAASVAFIIIHEVFSAARQIAREAVVRGWMERWRLALEGKAAPAGAKLSMPAIEAWLRLREAPDADAPALERLAHERGVGALLVKRLRTGRRAALLDAIENLARARLKEAVAPLLDVAVAKDPAVQQAALRAAARTLAADDGASDVAGFTEAVAAARLPPTPIEEVLLILGGAAPSVVRALLSMPELPPGHQRAALGAARHLRLTNLQDLVGALAVRGNPEVRSGALQALVVLGARTHVSADAVRAGLDDELDFLRIHATRAASHLPPMEALASLWTRLGDPSWWVRAAAAETLSNLGIAGRACLEKAAQSHPDRFARDMAGQQGSAGAQKVVA